MNNEEAKKKAEEINGKFESIEKTQNEISEKLKGLSEVPSNLKEDMEALDKKHEQLLKEQREDIVKLSKQIEEQELKAKRIAQGKGFSRDSEIIAKMEDNAEAIKELANGGGRDLTIKAAADMTSSNFSGDVVEPTRLPGVYYDPERTERIRNFMTIVPVATSSINYDQETAYTDGAATRSEGNAAGQSDLTLTEQTANVKNISTYLTISRESLTDHAFVAAYINTRLRSKLLSVEDNQILYGDGTGANLSGITTNATAYSDLLADSNVTKYDVLANAITNAIVNEYSPNVIFVHPQDILKLATTKDGAGNYVYPQGLQTPVLNVMGRPVIGSTAVTADDFIVGDFRGGATLGMRQDVEVMMSNSHSDNLTKNKVTIFMNERLALPIHNTKAFVYGDFTTAEAQGTA